VIGTRTDRGKQRLFKQDHEKYQDNPIIAYKRALEELSEYLSDIRNQTPQKTEQFISIEFSILKQTLLDLGSEYQTYIMEHLKKDAKNDLNSLIDEMRNTVQELKTPSTRLDILKRNKARYHEVRAKQSQLEARLTPIRQKFAFITDDSNNDQGVTELTDDEKMKLASLDEEMLKFQKGMNEAWAIIQKNYGEHKLEVDNSIDDFKKEVNENKSLFKQNAPFSVDKSHEFENAKKLDQLLEYKQNCAELRQKEEDMKPGLDIFGYDAQQYPELTLVEKENKLLTEVWELKDQFDNEWFIWKDISFYELNIDDIEQTVIDYYNNLTQKMPKDIKQWPIYDFLKSKFMLFREVLPLAAQLREESIRARHWNAIRMEVKEEFDENSEEFNLEKVFDLHLEKHINYIDDLCHNARAQLKIERSLDEIKRIWEEAPETNMDITKERSRNSSDDFYKIQSTDTILTLVEEHSQQLAAHKSSPYYKQFNEKIDFWENNISLITETIELLLQVQGKWLYLESIFKGQPDLAKQLSRENAAFIQIDKIFRLQSARIYKEQNCYRALIVNERDFIKTLTEMNRGLESIQKELRSFLESKRTQFPRFYFLSNEDLLEIIGQGKNPEPINKHIKKIFEGVNAIKTDNGTGRGADKVYIIKQIKSSDDETIELDGDNAVKTNTNVENWLTHLITSMQKGLQKLFSKYQNQIANSTSKRSMEKETMHKIIVDNLGQILITMSQLEWTTQVRNALKDMSEKGAEGNQNPMRKVKKMWQQKTQLLIDCVEKQGLPARERNKIISLIIIEEHNRQVIDQIAGNKACNRPDHFDWTQQLRFEKNDQIEQTQDQLMIMVRQLNASFPYGYEYQGNNGRLVITQLTDRAYMTLTNALSLFRGGAPQGPAGTGKTETVKDLGKNLAIYVVIQNCSDQMDQTELGRIFTGLAQSGSWGCFDEFNRILLDVLSVITSQVQGIMDAIKQGDKT
jgi:dynein heavy chain